MRKTTVCGFNQREIRRHFANLDETQYNFMVHIVCALKTEYWRYRLVAYGARLESVLGASPREFESPYLRT